MAELAVPRDLFDRNLVPEWRARHGRYPDSLFVEL